MAPTRSCPRSARAAWARSTGPATRASAATSRSRSCAASTATTRHDAPTFSCGNRFVTPRGSEGRTPDLWSLDLHLEYPIALGQGGASLALLADVFNATDNRRPVALDQQWNFNFLDETTDPDECGGDDPSCVDEDGFPLGNPDYGEPLGFQAPRRVQLGLRLGW